MFGRFKVLRALQRTPRFAAPETAFRPKSDHTMLAHWQRVRVRSTGVFDSSRVRISCGLILYSKGIKMMMLSRPRRAPDDNYRGHTGRRPGASDAPVTKPGGEGRAAHGQDYPTRCHTSGMLRGKEALPRFAPC